jgi:hypothetical protein
VKKVIAAVVFAMLFAAQAGADCIRDQAGKVVCGEGRCRADQFGVVYCARDYLDQVWCSKEAGGGAAVDSYGKVKCLGGCEAATAARCERAK